MRLPGIYWMSEDEVVEILIEGIMTSDDHFMSFLDILNEILFPIIIFLCSL